MQTQDAQREKLKGKLEELDAEFDKLKARAKQLSAQQRVAVDQRLHTMSAKIDRYKENLATAKDIAADEFDDLKDDVKDAWDRLKALEPDDKTSKH